MDKVPPEEERFKINVLDLTDLMHELATICWDAGRKDVDPNLIELAENYLDGYDSCNLIEVFIEHSYSHWSQIKNRDETFFIKNAHTIFKNLPVSSEHISAFRVFFEAKHDNGEYVICEDDRDAIWDIFTSLVKICIKYVHKVREITLVQTPAGLKPRYKYRRFDKINLSKLSKDWDVKLAIPGKD